MTALERIKEIEKLFDREDEPDQSEWIDTVKYLLRSFHVMREMHIESVISEHEIPGDLIYREKLISWEDDIFEERMKK